MFKHRFYELCHEFKNYYRIFTDGSKEGNRVAAAMELLRKMNLSFDHVSPWADVSCCLSQNILMTRNSTFDYVLLQSDEFPSFSWNFWRKMNLSFDHVSPWADVSCCLSQNILMTRNFDLQPRFTAEWWVSLILVELLEENELEFWPRRTAALRSRTRLMHILDWIL